jgi:transposase
LICDNYATHKHPKVQRRLVRHPRFNLHFTPTSASWLNMVERFFRDLTQNRPRSGVFRDLEELIMAIGTYIDRQNESVVFSYRVAYAIRKLLILLARVFN